MPKYCTTIVLEESGQTDVRLVTLVSLSQRGDITPHHVIHMLRDIQDSKHPSPHNSHTCDYLYSCYYVPSPLLQRTQCPIPQLLPTHSPRHNALSHHSPRLPPPIRLHQRPQLVRPLRHSRPQAMRLGRRLGQSAYVSSRMPRRW